MEGQAPAPGAASGALAAEQEKAALAEKGRQLRTKGAALEAVRDRQAAALAANKAKQEAANQVRRRLAAGKCQARGRQANAARTRGWRQ